MNQSADNPLVHSYLYLRRAVGLLGMTLPLIVIVGGLIVGEDLLMSVSGYYHTSMRNILVGGMCAVGVFLLFYVGHDRHDNIVSNIAGVAAIGVALCPVTAGDDPSDWQRAAGIAHLVFSGVFYLALAYFCLVLFRRGTEHPTRRKIWRNRVYAFCGYFMLACLALILLFGWALESATRAARPVLWLEAGAILAFGAAWLVKGQAILGDQPALQGALQPAGEEGDEPRGVGKLAALGE